MQLSGVETATFCSTTIQPSIKIEPPTNNYSFAHQGEPASGCLKDSVMSKFLKDQRNCIALESDNAFISSIGMLYLLSAVKPFELGKNVRAQCNLKFLLHAKMHVTYALQWVYSYNGKYIRNGETFHLGRT